MIGKYEKSDGDSVCQNCHRENIVWSAENELFNKINGSPNGVLCPKCFENKAEEKGVKIIFEAKLIK